MFDTQHKRKGLISSIIVHALLIVLFIFFGLKYQDPPPETGVAIVFGFDEQGSGEIKPVKTAPQSTVKEVTEEPEQEVQEEVVEESPAPQESTQEAEEELMTQETEEAIAINAAEKKKREEEARAEQKRLEEERIKREKAEAERKRKEREEQIKAEKRKNLDNMFSGLTSDSPSKSDASANQGDDGADGYKGSENGSEDSNSFYGNGGVGSDGNYQLGNRKAIEKPLPVFDSADQGIVYVRIIVDRNGKVIYAEPGVKGSTTTDIQLLQRAKEAAMKTTWQSDPTAAERQEGRIIYNFVIEN